ncbi:hypothetical protein GCM10023189_25020 [Nibrella saemangeumensis]|uniref:Alkylhydroperoxidase family enzyme, contains CxxC motif n=1 Tax=Nibrella saemangeumensis TaxID=1084526 RepID=A0ABP8MXI5_9BACT
MPRINPLPEDQASDDLRADWERHIADYPGSRITNMKATLSHSRLAFQVYMQWYPLYEEVKTIVGNRLAYLFAHAISQGSDCPLCTTFFRRIIVQNGERPEDLQLSDDERLLLRFGSEMAQNKGDVLDELYQEIEQRYTPEQVVRLVAFAGQMIATNVFSNALRVDIDEYLYPYLPLTKPVY